MLGEGIARAACVANCLTNLQVAPSGSFLKGTRPEDVGIYAGVPPQFRKLPPPGLSQTQPARR